MPVMTKTLIEKAQHGDAAAFTELTRRYRNLAFGYALSILHDFHLAEDAAQEAFIAVPVGTVNSRLHAARGRLKRRMLAMAKDAFKENALPEAFAEKVGKIVQ